MMVSLFKGVVETSLSMIPLMVLLLLLAPVLRRRYAPRLMYLLTLVVSLRLVLPVSFPGTALLRLPENGPGDYPGNDRAAILRAFAALSEWDASGSTATGMGVEQGVSWIGVAAAAWALGAIAFLLYGLALHRYKTRKLRRWNRPVKAAALELYESIKREMEIAANIPLYENSLAAGPLLLGLLRPLIILPQRDFTPAELEGILRHELMHHRRRDLFLKALLLCVQALHWANPFVYLFLRQTQETIELSCDAAVLRGRGAAFRKGYGLTVLSFAGRDTAGLDPLSTAFSGGKRRLFRRIGQIAAPPACRRGSAVLCGAVLLAVLSGILVGFATPVPVGNSVDEAFAGQLLGAAGLLRPDDTLLTVYDDGEMAWPVPDSYYVSAGYGWRYEGRDYHTGVDIAGEDIYGQPVVAAEDGVVLFRNKHWSAGAGYGQYLILEHADGISTLYAHLSEVVVQPGSRVKKGQKIAEVGATGYATGAQLHFEVRRNGMTENPLPYFVGVDDDRP